MFTAPYGEVADLPLKTLAPFKGMNILSPAAIAHVCPHCGIAGTFNSSQEYSYSVSHKTTQGTFSSVIGCSIRFCPNPKCLAPVFMLVHNGHVLHSFPTPRIDFDGSRLPQQIFDSLNEAIGCHAAQCYRASALLVRRTIEEVCKDKGATGKNLKARIQNLATVMTLPPALIAAMDELRLLGNDAAHVDAADYDNIGVEEASVAIMLAKEIVKASYQYDSLLEALSALRKDIA